MKMYRLDCEKTIETSNKEGHKSIQVIKQSVSNSPTRHASVAAKDEKVVSDTPPH